MRVLVCGYQHETNTFAASKADWAAFNRGDSFPAYIEGNAMVESMKGVNLPMGGFIDTALSRGWALAPGFWCGATPSSYVTEDAFERISAAFLRFADSCDYDAIYIDFHGAGVAEHIDDTEGEVLFRLRQLVGNDMPIVASLDLHANVTHRMLDGADALVAFRTYPHVDMAKTGALAALLLERRVLAGSREKLAFRRVPFLIATNSQSTFIEPAKGHFQLMESLDNQNGTIASFAMGFPAADFEECAPMVWAYGDKAQETLDALVPAIFEPTQWQLKSVFLPDDAVQRALSLAAGSDRPIVIADTQDNPSGGADGNTSGLLHALLRNKVGQVYPLQAVIGVIHDPETAAQAHQAGIGATIEAKVGTSVRTFTGESSELPVEGRFKVIQLSNGEVALQGPMMTGLVTQLGPTALLEISGLYVIVSTGKMQLLDRVQISMMGLDPSAMRIIAIKSANHFRADFVSLVRDPETDFIIAKCPGPKAVDPGDYHWTRLPESTARRPV
ncbi:MAG: M81 family metallopeptidase [Pusillimonas sp.]